MLEEARQRLATLLGCRPGDVVFTSGATESNNTMVFHLARCLQGVVLVSGIEHPSILAPARRWLADRHELIPTLRSGVANLDWLEARLRTRPPAGVLLMAANNETGVHQPCREAAALCRDHGVPFGCDAAQWIGKLPADGLGACDLVAGCAHKFGGPPGVGFLKAPGNLVPWLVGGPQEDRRRGGTENLPGIVAMLAALVAREQAMAAGAVADRQAWRDSFLARLHHAMPASELLGSSVPRLWNTATLILPRRADKRRWVVVLDRLGFAVSSGSACSSGEEKASHVLEAMGYSADEASRAVRFSSGWETPANEWDALLEAVVSAGTLTAQ